MTSNIGAPTRDSYDRGELADSPDLPIDVRAARAWHRYLVEHNMGRDPYVQNLRMYVRFAVEANDLAEAHQRLVALLAYVDYREPTPPVLGDMTADWKVVRNLSDAITECTGHAIEQLTEGMDLPTNDENFVVALEEQSIALATTGRNPR